MRRATWFLSGLAGVLVVVLGGGAWWFVKGKPDSGGGGPGEEAGQTEEPVARVTVVPIRLGSIEETLTVYGSVIPAPGAVQVFSVPYESRVKRLAVSPGQRVSRGDTLLEIAPSADAQLLLDQARNGYLLAKRNLETVQRRFDLRLATNEQLLQATQALQQAQLNLQSLEGRGIGERNEIHVDVSGLVTKVPVEEGAIVPAGSSLVEVIAENRLEVLLGVEPEDIVHVQTSQEVSLSRLTGATSVMSRGRVRKTSHSVNASTRLVDVFVTLGREAGFLLGEPVVSQLRIASSRGLIVPRSAVQPLEGQYILFTVKNQVAERHVVLVGIENEREVEVIGDGLRPGDAAVILGNHELRNGMAVRPEAAR